MSAIRRATHAGSWYDDEEEVLDGQLQEWLDAVDKKEIPSPPTSVIEVGLPEWSGASSSPFSLPVTGCKAIIAPHAGYSYSGPAAAYAYKCIDPSVYKRVFVLGLSHSKYYDGSLLSGCDKYDTPLGELPLDKETINELRATGQFLPDVSRNVEDNEHSLELHLPYIRKVFQKQDISIVPIMIGALSATKEMKMGELLAPYLKDKSTLFVVSSDFCHWGERFSYTCYQSNLKTKRRHLTSRDAITTTKPAIHTSIRALDGTAISHLTFPASLPIPDASNLSSPSSSDDSTANTTQSRSAKQSFKEFHTYLQETHNTICGRHPIGVLMATLSALEDQGIKSELQFTRYEQSSKCVSVHDSSVSYASAFARFI